MIADLTPIHRVAVFRALMLGDLLCATPALRALRHGLPGARITLAGLPWARALAERLASVDDFVPCPGWPGLPEQPPGSADERAAFVERMRGSGYQLALQMHGSGGVVNPLVASFGARHSAGYANAAAWRPEADAALYIDWPETGTEVERMLALTDHLGLKRQGTQLDFPLRDSDRAEAERLCAPLHGRRFAIVHTGSQLPSRRWPAARFAAVADALAADGLAVVLTGSAAEAGLTAAVAAAMRSTALDLAGRTTLWGLGALVEWAALVVSNDTGISHIAAALATPSVVISSGADVARWAPADNSRHRVLWRDMPCRPCAHVSCPTGHECALGVGVEDVVAAVRRGAWPTNRSLSSDGARSAGAAHV